MGLRVDRVVPVGDDRAWVAIAGRNLDGTSYRYAELWIRRGSVWHERETPLPEDLKLLPGAFPPPYAEYQGVLDTFVDAMLANMARGQMKKPPPKKPAVK